MTDLKRRDFLKAGSYLALLQGTQRFASAYSPDAPAGRLPIIDAHIHLFDPTRPGGVPWPEPSDTVLYKPALPPRYQKLAEPFGVVGAIAVECSPLAADNDWLLTVAAKNPIMLGMIGDLDPASPDFPKQLERLNRNPLFRGIRYGNLWGRDLGTQLGNAGFVANLKRLAKTGLSLESANPNPVLIAQLLKLTDLVPDLRIVIDHLPQAVPPAELTARQAYERNLQALSHRPNLFVKGSEILRNIDGRVPKDLATYKSWLDTIWGIFGEDRLLFGSDWPNSDHLASYGDTFEIIRQYVASKSAQARQKFYYKNSIAAYRWHPRTTSQKALHIETHA